MRRNRKGLLGGALAVLVVLWIGIAPTPAYAEDQGFWYGTDSGGPGPVGSSAPYNEPGCSGGHAYGGYIGKIGGADLVRSDNPTGYGPGFAGSAWNSTYSAKANNDHFNFNQGVGSGGFWWMEGPASAPAGMSAYTWGSQQGEWADLDWMRWYDNGNHRMPLRILWADVEVGASGWTNGAADRLVFNGFFDTILAANNGLVPGVYSTKVQWDSIMAGNTSIPNTWEWTAQTATKSVPSPCPIAFGNAVFFGGQTASSAHAAMWQFVCCGAAGDYDQINANRNLPD